MIDNNNIFVNKDMEILAIFIAGALAAILFTLNEKFQDWWKNN